MREDSYILAVDQGTTSTRAILFGREGTIAAQKQMPLTQHYPHSGWVEHDASEIWQCTVSVIREVLREADAGWEDIQAVGVTNQRETVVVWDRDTGEPVAPAIVWQCRRTAARCDELRARGHLDEIRLRTGLEIDAYFSATKLEWILDNVPGVRERAGRGELLAGTIDSWLIWNLSGRKAHVTDVSNAARTMLFNIHQLRWDPWLLELLRIPASLLPAPAASCGIAAIIAAPELMPAGAKASNVPIAGIAGDQQAALFGQLCFQPGMVKNTYGTGGFILLQTGQQPMSSSHHLITTLGWQIAPGIGQERGFGALRSQTVNSYALEGSVFNSGSTVQWLRDELGLIGSSAECEELARSVPDSGGVVVVPSFTGLGAPWWNMQARGMILGLSRGSTKAHICRAVIEAMALQSADVVLAMAADSQQPLRKLRVDGGAAVNDLLLQYQADVLGVSIERPSITETTALGAAFMAGLAVGFWQDIRELSAIWQLDREFRPHRDSAWRAREIERWTRAVETVQYHSRS